MKTMASSLRIYLNFSEDDYSKKRAFAKLLREIAEKFDTQHLDNFFQDNQTWKDEDGQAVAAVMYQTTGYCELGTID